MGYPERFLCRFYSAAMPFSPAAGGRPSTSIGWSSVPSLRMANTPKVPTVAFRLNKYCPSPLMVISRLVLPGGLLPTIVPAIGVRLPPLAIVNPAMFELPALET